MCYLDPVNVGNIELLRCKAWLYQPQTRQCAKYHTMDQAISGSNIEVRRMFLLPADIMRNTLCDSEL